MNTSVAFKLAIIALVLTAISICGIYMLHLMGLHKAGSVLGYPMLVACTLSIAGLYYSVKSLKEPGGYKKIIAMVVHLGFGGLLLFIIFTNLLDIIKLFGQ